jgi:tetratricopeptide (TPR) repeat protein
MNASAVLREEERQSSDGDRLAAIALQKQGRIEEAIPLYRRAIVQNPADASAYRCLGTAHKARGERELAKACFRRALELGPLFPAAWNNLGNVLLDDGELDEAADCFRRAARIQPDFAGAHFNLGQVLSKQGQFDLAIDAYRKATAIEPQNADFHCASGATFFAAQRIDDALAACDRAIALRPDFGSAHYNRSLAWLLCGDHERGWPEYEWRFRRTGAAAPSFVQPRWDGANSKDTAILLDAEQGLGDTIQFVRYAPWVRARVGKLILRCQKPLRLLLRGAPGIDQIVTQDEPLPDFDAWFPLMSVPLLFPLSIDAIPRWVPYLSAERSLIDYWTARFKTVDGFRIGIHWQGNPRFPNDRFRSIPLACFAPLAGVEGTSLISLQKGAGTEQLRAAPPVFPVIDVGLTLDEIHGPFLDTAAILLCLDLVITSDTSLAHLAGALGVETWLAVPHVPEWRWLLGRADSPWYPTLRLFRQKRVGQWSELFSQMAAALRDRVRGAPIAEPIGKLRPLAPG